MPENEVRDREAWEVGDVIRSAVSIVETAIKTEDPASKKALQAAAKQLLQNAIDRLDESVGAAVADEDEED